ncbi:transposase [Nesterenkonia muleiensis]|uniref:transposase n=1 Tax=Nesterenkonia muleiensis TaxID=2282648 RepID=UPI000E724CD2
MIHFYGIRRLLQTGIVNLTEKQCQKIKEVITADPRHEEVFLAFQCTQELRAANQHKDLRAGRRIAIKVLESFRSCPVPEIARLGRTLRRWRTEILAYFTTARANNGGTEAIKCRRGHLTDYADKERLKSLLTSDDTRKIGISDERSPGAPVWDRPGVLQTWPTTLPEHCWIPEDLGPCFTLICDEPV